MPKKRDYFGEALDRIFELFEPMATELTDRLSGHIANQFTPIIPPIGQAIPKPPRTKIPLKTKPAAKSTKQPKPAAPKVVTLYETLGVSQTCPPEVLMAAWKAIARTCHPDIAGPSGEERMKAANAAYSVLSDPEKRREYDRWLAGN